MLAMCGNYGPLLAPPVLGIPDVAPAPLALDPVLVVLPVPEGQLLALATELANRLRVLFPDQPDEVDALF